MHKYIVCIGSNYNRKENLTFARQKLTESFSSICFAPELETKPLFFKNPALFSNQVVLFYSDKDEETVRKMLKDIEQRSGRRSEDKKEENFLELYLPVMHPLVFLRNRWLCWAEKQSYNAYTNKWQAFWMTLM